MYVRTDINIRYSFKGVIIKYDNNLCNDHPFYMHAYMHISNISTAETPVIFN